jgi:hypothetical protein
VLSSLLRDNQDENRIASPRNVPKDQCRCITRMFSISSRVGPIVSLHVV